VAESSFALEHQAGCVCPWEGIEVIILSCSLISCSLQEARGPGEATTVCVCAGRRHGSTFVCVSEHIFKLKMSEYVCGASSV